MVPPSPTWAQAQLGLQENILWLTKFSLPTFGFQQDPAVVLGSSQDFNSDSR